MVLLQIRIFSYFYFLQYFEIIELQRQVQSEPAKLSPIGVYFHLEEMLCLFLLNQVSTHSDWLE